MPVTFISHRQECDENGYCERYMPIGLVVTMLASKTEGRSSIPA